MAKNNHSASATRPFFTLYVGESLPAASLLLSDRQRWTMFSCCKLRPSICRPCCSILALSASGLQTRSKHCHCNNSVTATVTIV